MNDVDVLVFTAPQNENIFDAIYHNIDRWKTFLVDRDALELCSILEYMGMSTQYLPFNLLFPFYTNEYDPKISSLILRYTPKCIIGVNFFLNEGLMYSNLLRCLFNFQSLYSNHPPIIAIGKFPSYEKSKLEKQGVSFAGTYSEFYANFTILNNLLKKELISTNFIYQPFKWIPAYEKLKQFESIITYNKQAKWYMYIRTSIGCPFHCAFCSSSSLDKNMNYISNEFLEKEISYINANLGLENITFDCIVDDSFGIDVNKSYKTIAILQNYDIKVSYVLMRADQINNSTELLSKLKSITEYILIGVENSDNNILNNIQKGETFKDILNAIIIVKKIGLKTHLNWIIGLPGQDYENIYNNMKVMAFLIRSGLADEIEPQILIPFPWTKIFLNKERYGIRDICIDWNKYDENGFNSSIEYENLSYSSIERAYFFSLLLCYKTKAMVWPQDRAKQLLNLTAQQIIEKYLTFQDLGNGDKKIVQNELK